MKGFYGAQEIVVDEKLVKDFHVLSFGLAGRFLNVLVNLVFRSCWKSQC